MMERSWIICVGILSFACAVSPSQAGTIHPEILEKLKNLSPEDEISVIVTLVDQQNLKQFKSINKKSRRQEINRALRDTADKTQKPLNDFLNKKKATKIIPFWIFNGMAATLRADQVDELAQRPEVKSLRLDSLHRLPPRPLPAAASVPEWNLDAINAPALWARRFTGAGVVIASMDTGVDAGHPDLASRWRGGGNSWFDPHGEHATPYDQDGHGTQTMGVMVGGDAGGTSIGVAPGASWIAVKLYNDAGITTDSFIHLGFQWLLDPDSNPGTDDAPDVVNNSWGYDQRVNECVTEFQPDVQVLKAAGIAVVFSAGNGGPGASTSVSPANYPEGFAVGGVDETLTVTLSSSRGPSACDGAIFPEIVAPGANIRTADLTFGGVNPDPYATLSGTSFAAPHVSGAMALLLSASPQLTVDDLETLLALSAADRGAPGPDHDYGNGLLDVEAAYASFYSFPWSLFVPALTGQAH